MPLVALPSLLRALMTSALTLLAFGGAHSTATVWQRATLTSPPKLASAVPSPLVSILFWIAIVAVRPLPSSDAPQST